MKFKVQAESDPFSQVFVYSGKELAGPLKTLESFLESEIERLEKAIERAKTEGRDSPPPTMVNFSNYDTETVKLTRELNKSLVDLADTKIWLAECQRKPAFMRNLSIHQLRWIFRDQIDARVRNEAIAARQTL